MNLGRVRIYVAVVLVGLGIWLLIFNERAPVSQDVSQGGAVSESVKDQNDSSPGDEKEATSSEGSQSNSAEVSKDFKDWVSRESINLEKSSLDPKAQETELRARAEKLSTAEVNFLLQRSLDIDGVPANERILSVYLLTLAAQNAQEALIELTQAPLKMRGEYPTHSPEETLAMQEKTLRRMAIDQLVASTKGNADKRADLEKQFDRISDSSLREYAKKVLAKTR